MRRLSHRQRLVIALVASLAGHVCLLVWSLNDAPKVTGTSTKPLQVEIQMVAAPPTPPPPVPPPTVQPQAVPTKKRTTVSEAPPVAAPAAAPAPMASDSPLQATAEAPTRATNSAPSLTPSFGVITGLSAPTREAPSGSTLRNDPSEKVDREAMAEYSGEKAARTVTNLLNEELGKARSAVGNVPGFFRAAQASMSNRVGAEGPEVDQAQMAAAIARDVAGALMRAPSKEAADAVMNTPLGHSIVNQTVTAPGADSARFREAALSMLGQGEALSQAARAPKLKTTIEVTVEPGGGVADAHIIERSGDKNFDESALHFSRKVIRDLPDNDDKALGTSMWKSRWQFTYEPPSVRVRLLSAWPVL